MPQLDDEDEDGVGCDGGYEPIAIVGIGCRFPGAHGPLEYWKMLRKGEPQARPMPKDPEKRRWNNDHLYNPDAKSQGTITHKTVCVLDEMDRFDSEFFHLSPKEAAEMDPQHRILLETTYESLEDAGWSLQDLVTPDNNVGVYVGAYAPDWTVMATPDMSVINNYTLQCRPLFMISNRLSHWFGLEGPSMTVDTACSSSLTCLHLACRALQQGECRVAFACGANLLLHPFFSVGLSRQGVFSKDGVLRAFDKQASGYVRGEGFGTLVLKPASQARADGDRIYAYVRGSKVHSGGKTKIITKPNAVAEAEMMVKTLKLANVSRDDISFVEAHGTGTPVGDAIELKAITDAYRPNERETGKPVLKIGSVKSIIGHAEPASGVASIIKMALCLHYGAFTPNANFAEPNDVLNGQKIQVQTTFETIKGPREKLLVAVNSFGIGGTLAHAILQVGDTHASWRAKVDSSHVGSGWTLSPSDEREGERQFFPLSAATKSVLTVLLMKWKSYVDPNLTRTDATSELTSGTALDFEFLHVDSSLVALGLSRHRSHLASRVLISATSSKTFLQDLDRVLESLESIPRNALQRGASVSNALFVFPGQGPQCIWMAQQLYGHYEVFRNSVLATDNEFLVQTGVSLIQKMKLFQGRTPDPENPDLFEDPRYCQSAILMVQIAITHLLESFGVSPTACLGHSGGDVAACWAAGLLTLQEAVQVAIARAEAFGNLHRTGGMLVLMANEEKTNEIVASADHGSNWFCEIAAKNSLQSTVLTGSMASLTRMKEVAESAGVKSVFMHTSTPYHSSAIEKYERAMKEKLAKFEPKCGTERSCLPLYSSTLGRCFDRDKDTLCQEYWWTNVRNSVKFREATRDMWEASASPGGPTIDYVVEISNHPVLGSALLQVFAESNVLASAPPTVLNPLNRHKNEIETFQGVLKRCFELGSRLSFGQLTSLEQPTFPVASLKLPIYPWKHDTSLWVESETSQNSRYGKVGTGTISSSLHHAGGPMNISLGVDQFLKDHVVDGQVVFPAAGYLVTAARCTDVSEGSVPGATMPAIVLRSVRFQSPLILSEEKATPLHLKWPRTGGNTSRFSYTNPESSTTYCSGTTDTMTAERVMATFRNLQPPGLDKSTPSLLEKDAIYQNLASRGLQYGPSFQNLQLAISNAGSAYAFVRGIAPEARCFDASVLDSCFQLCVLLTASNGKAYVPFGLERYIQIFQPEARRQLLVEAQALGKEQGKEQFDIKIWQMPVDSENTAGATLCAVCEQLTVSPLGAFSKDSHFGYETVYQPVSLARDWSSVTEVLNDSFRQGDPVGHDDVPPLALLLVKEWASTRYIVSDDSPRGRFEKALAEEGATRKPNSTLRHLSEVDNNKESVLKASLETFHKTPLFEYFDGIFEPLFQVVAPLAKSRDVLRLAFIVPSSDALLIESIAEYLGATKRWWKSMEIVFFVNGRDVPAVSSDSKAVFRERGLSSRGEAFTDLQKHILGEYDVGDFHALLSVNSHRLSRCEECLRHFLHLLSPAGIFLAAEVTNITVQGLLTIAAHETWWSFADDRPGSKSWFDVEDWRGILGRAGFHKDSFCSIPLSETKECITSLIVSRVSSLSPVGVTKALFADVSNKFTEHSSDSTFSCGTIRGPLVNIPSKEYDSKSGLIAKNDGSVLVFLLTQQFLESETTSNVVWKLTELLQRVCHPQGGRIVVTLAGDHPNNDAVVGLCRAICYESKVNLQTLWVCGKDVPLQCSSWVAYAIGTALTTPQLACQPEMRFINGDWCAPKIVRCDVQLLKPPYRDVPKSQNHWHLEMPPFSEHATPTIKDAFFGHRPLLSHTPPEDSVRIAVKAVGLNFKHSMILLGMLPTFGLHNAGGECAGVITDVGDAEYAKRFGLKLGDRVVAMLRSAGIGTVTESLASLVFKIPKGLSFEEAATIPICYSTAYLGLVKKASLQSGETVLIHSAAGGVGQAAIQVAKMRGGRIIASVSSEEKRRFLREQYGIHDFVASRSLEFETEVMRITNGKGVDVVVNSLAGEALKAGVRCLTFGGRFIEIGKIDILGGGLLPLRGFEHNLSFLSCHVDILLNHAAAAHELLKELFQCFYDGRLKPLPHHVCKLSDAVDELKRMSKGQHIGKIVATVPDNFDFSDKATTTTLNMKASASRRLRPDATYLITGGLGSIGLAVAEQMALHGAKRVVLVSRRPPRTSWQHTCLGRIRKAGASVSIECIDVVDLDAVTALIRKYSSQEHCLQGIASIAGVTDDAPFAAMTRQKVEGVINTKVQGAWNLHMAAKSCHVDLDFFLMTSSLVAAIGNLSQTNYAAANLFLAGLMRIRHTEGLPASVIDLGAVEGEFGSGMIQSTDLIDNLASRGLLALSVQQAANGHMEMMTPSNWDRHIIFGKFRWRLNGSYPSITRRYTHLAAQSNENSWGEQQKIESATSKIQKVQDALGKELSRLLGMDPNTIDSEMPLANYGLDSLGSVQFISFLKNEAGIVATQFDILGNASINSLLSRMPESGEVITAVVRDRQTVVARDRNNVFEGESREKGNTQEDKKNHGKQLQSNAVPVNRGAKASGGDSLATYSKTTQKAVNGDRVKDKRAVKKLLAPKNDGARSVTQHPSTTTRESPRRCLNPGIWAMDYFSSDIAVTQKAMELSRGPEAAGHFTQGFGQESIACMQDHTTVASLALSALSKLFRTSDVSPGDVGYLAVGTESNPDRSKSIKSILMTLFEESGNFNVEGVDHLSACYGGVAALFDALAWMESSAWDGRFAVVVVTDAALIDAPDDVFNGHSSFAVLLGPEALVQILPKRYSYHHDSWDFYQPVAYNRHTPIVQFEQSIEAYLSSLEHCRDGFCSLYNLKRLNDFSNHLVMHGPNVSMMRKGFRRLLEVEKEASSPDFVQKFDSVVGPSLTLVKQMGSLYTASVFAGMYSLLYGHAEKISGTQIPVFAFGSGLGATMFAIQVSESWKRDSELKLEAMWTPMKTRNYVTPVESQRLLAVVHQRDSLEDLPFTPSSTDYVPGAWYLKSIDDEAMYSYHQPVPFNRPSGCSTLTKRPRFGFSPEVGSTTDAQKARAPNDTAQPPSTLFTYEPHDDPLLAMQSVSCKTFDGLQVFESESVMTLIFARPERKNTFDYNLLRYMIEVLQTVGNRVIVLRGLGATFSGGLDLSSDMMSDFQQVHRNISLYQKLLSLLEEHPFPIVTVCHGCCFAGGMGFAGVADFVVSDDHCVFGLPEIDNGLLPLLVSKFLSRRVSQHIVKELAMTGRELSAREAREIGLVSVVSNDVNAVVVKFVQKMARSDDRLLKMAKAHIPTADNDSAKALMAVLMSQERKVTTDTQEHLDTCKLHISEHGVATISINTPDAAITPGLSKRFEEIVSRLSGLVEEQRVRCVILRSNRDHFCTGGDIQELVNWMSSNEMTTIARSFYLYVSFVKLRDLPVPIIVGFKGKVIGAGIGVGMVGDVRICSADTTFDLAFFRHNLSPGMATTATLATTVGTGMFMEMVSGTVIHADRAASVGIVHDVVEDPVELDRVLLDRALRFINADPRAVQRTLQMLRSPVEERDLLREAANQGTCFAEQCRILKGDEIPLTLSTEKQQPNARGNQRMQLPEGFSLGPHVPQPPTKPNGVALVMTTREALQCGLESVWHTTIGGNKGDKPRKFSVCEFPDYLDLQKQIKQSAAAGLRFPFFVEHDSIIAGTSHIAGQRVTDFSGYNYLGLVGHSEVNHAAEQAIRDYGTSVSASRMASGERRIHRLLETEIAQFLGCQDSLVYSAGYLAIASAVRTLAKSSKDLVVFDSLIHQSAMDGIAASPADSTMFPHNNWRHVDNFLSKNRDKYELVVLVLEGAYSVDGDLPDLPAFCRLRHKYKVLIIVDEAHSLGCCGKTGRGVGEHFGVDPSDVDIWAGTLSKSLASCGGYIAGQQDMINYFKLTSPGFVFSAGISPANTAAALCALKILQREPHRVVKLQRNAQLFWTLAQDAGLNTLECQGECGVVPVFVGGGDVSKAMQIADALYQQMIHVQPIGYPAVPKGGERLRFFLSSEDTPEQIKLAVDACSGLLSHLD